MEEKQNRTAAIVVTYNRKQLLLACIEGLMWQTCREFDILVIDNASTDGTRSALQPWIDAGSLTYHNTGRNLGGAGGFHCGIKRAVLEGYQRLWIMDDDTVPSPNALQALLDAGRRCGEYGYLSSRALWKDGSLCRMNIQRDPRLRSLREYTKALIPSGAATFVSLLIPARVVLEVGLPIPEFFIWADDLEYTRRISRRYPCYVVTDSVVEHRCETNNGGNIATDAENRIGRYRYAYRNEVVLYRREGLRGLVHLLLRTPLHVARVLVKSKTKKLRRIGVILGGTLQGVGFRPAVEYVDAAHINGRQENGDV